MCLRIIFSGSWSILHISKAEADRSSEGRKEMLNIFYVGANCPYKIIGLNVAYTFP
jgi:hypothetical protein